MKVSIIGGGGRVGASAAFALHDSGLVNEIALVDVALELAQGEALDLLHGTSLVASQKIYGGGFDAVSGSNVIVITAGLRRKPDESRLDLINRNVALFRNVLDQIKSATLPDDAIILVVSNPVDVLTQLAVEAKIVSENRVIGLGTLLDTTRFRSLLGEYLNINPTDIDVLILGEHGDSMVPIWSTASVNGVPLKDFPGYSQDKVQEIFARTQKSGAEVIKLKGGAGYAVGISIREVVHAVLLDKRAVLPVSALQKGALGISDVCLSLPTIVGSAGVQGIIEISVSDQEKEGIQNCARVLKDTLSQIA